MLLRGAVRTSWKKPRGKLSAERGGVPLIHEGRGTARERAGAGGAVARTRRRTTWGRPGPRAGVRGGSGPGPADYRGRLDRGDRSPPGGGGGVAQVGRGPAGSGGGRRGGSQTRREARAGAGSRTSRLGDGTTASPR